MKFSGAMKGEGEGPASVFAPHPHPSPRLHHCMAGTAPPWHKNLSPSSLFPPNIVKIWTNLPPHLPQATFKYLLSSVVLYYYSHYVFVLFCCLVIVFTMSSFCSITIIVLLHLLCIYLNCIRPHLEYACQLWDPHSSKGTQALEVVQIFACKVCLKKWDLDYERMLQLLDLQVVILYLHLYFVMCSQDSKSSNWVSHDSHTNYQFLSSAEKDERLHNLEMAKITERKRNKRLSEKHHDLRKGFILRRR